MFSSTSSKNATDQQAEKHSVADAAQFFKAAVQQTDHIAEGFVVISSPDVKALARQHSFEPAKDTPVLQTQGDLEKALRDAVKPVSEHKIADSAAQEKEQACGWGKLGW